MIIDQGELLSGMAMMFVKEFMDIAEMKSYEKDVFLFHEGEPADHFYTLIKGSVRLSIVKAGHKVYKVSNAGEAFGWSSLLDRDTYTASAECADATTLLKFDSKRLTELLKKHPESGLIFYRNLSKNLGNRVMTLYKIISEAS